MHEGQLFGIANQLLGLFTALGLLTMCVSAIVMWWRRRPEGQLGIPAPRVPEFRIGPALMIAIVAVALLFPVLGAWCCDAGMLSTSRGCSGKKKRPSHA